MGQTRRRTGGDGRPRYTAYYDDTRGRRRSAGTFATRRDADLAWHAAEVSERCGHPGTTEAGRLTFATYVTEHWFPNHVVEPTTREGYTYCLRKHILPWFGLMKMRDILPMHVRQWVTELAAAGVSPAQIRHLKIILSAVFTTALNDFVVALHPCRGVKTPTVPVKEYRIVSPAEYERIAAALPSDAARLLIEMSIGTGLRWGELAELRRRDLNPLTGILTITRAVVEINPKYHPTGDRFLVKPYPKTKHSRRFKLDRPLVEAVLAHVEARALGLDDLILQLDHLELLRRPRLVDVDALGLTEPDARGRRYRHGSLSAYSAARCRCEFCRGALADYRARRRNEGLDSPRGVRRRDTDGHIPRDWFRSAIWHPACDAAGLDPRPRMHDLRHSHASWLLAGGADLQVVRERLGHASIATTSKYLHTLPTADETALDALRLVRYGRS